MIILDLTGDSGIIVEIESKQIGQIPNLIASLAILP
jgi:hypothetical protein